MDTNKVFEFLSRLHPVHAAIASYLLFSNGANQEVIKLARLSPPSRPDWVRALAGITNVNDKHNRSVAFEEARHELKYALKENNIWPPLQ